MEMTVITDVKAYTAPGPTHMVVVEDPKPLVIDHTKCAIMHQERIQGREFIDRHGRSRCIGWTRDVGEVLGIVYESWDDIQRREYEQRMASNDAYKRLASIRKAPWWRRLRWLFTGVEA